jgi:hypothetical protein
MSYKRGRAKGRGEKPHSFVQFPHYMLRSPQFQQLSARACKVLFYLAAQYKGKNNGDLQATYTLAKSAGIRSAANLRAGTVELEEAGFIVKSRNGGRNSCSLYALTWFPVDDCKGKLENIAASHIATNAWRHGTLSTPPAVQLRPPAVQSVTNGCDSDAPLNRRRSSQAVLSNSIEPPAVTFLEVIPSGDAISDASPLPSSEALLLDSEARKRGRPRKQTNLTTEDAA